MSTYWNTSSLDIPQGNAFNALKDCLESKSKTEQASDCRRKYFTAYKQAVAQGVAQQTAQPSSLLALSKKR
jgi:hypothetical protein